MKWTQIDPDTEFWLNLDPDTGDMFFFLVKNHLGEKNKKLYLNAKFLPSILHIFCLQFILFLPLWIQIRIRNADSQSCLIRI